jgi:hypothetical protein
MEPESSQPHSQLPAICPYPEPDQSSPFPHIPLPEDPSYYYPIYVWVFQVVSFLQISPPKPCKQHEIIFILQDSNLHIHRCKKLKFVEITGVSSMLLTFSSHGIFYETKFIPIHSRCKIHDTNVENGFEV